ncbi:hypothetical protein [Pseudarthrobacter sp. Y6]|uniref:hypothetical protein n=1 Tax=Pseudarthrobacter sp. Y6 TaxID=3418422 RepID=UPI003CF065B3
MAALDQCKDLRQGERHGSHHPAHDRRERSPRRDRGLYYSFACSVMPGLRATDDATFVSAMSRINAAIQNPVSALSFVGAFLALAGSAGR